MVSYGFSYGNSHEIQEWKDVALALLRSHWYLAERLAHGRGAVVAVVGRGRWRLAVWFAALNRNIFLWIYTRKGM